MVRCHSQQVGAMPQASVVVHFRSPGGRLSGHRDRCNVEVSHPCVITTWLPLIKQSPIPIRIPPKVVTSPEYKKKS